MAWKQTYMAFVLILSRNLTDHEALASRPRATRYVADFMLQTGLLGQLRHGKVEPEPDPEDDETTYRDRLVVTGGEDAMDDESIH
ncbi:hypothetical protein N7454_003456 [Penicillium verhagenii]|nr:hypothetical protein N7454_003456 [Penicillium verhagenii]